MKRALPLAVLALPLMLFLALSAGAQNWRVKPPRTQYRVGTVGHYFLPGIGLRPVIREQVPVFGLGFDAHHFRVTRGRRGTFGRSFGRRFHGGFHGGFRGGFRGGFSGGFRGRNSFGFVSFPFLPYASTGSTVVVVQQAPVAIPVQQAPVVILDESGSGGIPVAAGLPYNWGRVRVARSSFPREAPRPPHLTLLVLKDETIIPARDYWLEDGRVFYVTSTGRQDSFLLRDLDWEMTTELNAERNIDFVLRSP